MMVQNDDRVLIHTFIDFSTLEASILVIAVGMTDFDSPSFTVSVNSTSMATAYTVSLETSFHQPKTCIIHGQCSRALIV